MFVAQLLLFPSPVGQWIDGLILGLLTALIALGIVLVYRANRVLNFAQGELGLLPAVLAVMLIMHSSFHYVWGFLIGLVASIVLGAAAEFFIIRRFFRAPRLVLTVATLGLAQVLGFLGLYIPSWWDERAQGRIDSPWDLRFELGGFTFDDNDVIAVIAVPLLLLFVGALLRYTSLGIAVRAAADMPDRAGLLGIPVQMLQTFIWALACMLAYVAIFLRAGILGLPVGGALGLLFFLRGLTAAVVGRLSDLKAVFAASLSLGMLQGAITWNYPREAEAMMGAASALVILVALLARRRDFSRFDVTRASLAVGDIRPIPKEMRRLPEVIAGRAALAVLCVGFAVLVPQIFGPVNILRIADLYIFAIGLLSLVVLTGWAGQISLGQAAFMGIGGAASGWLTLHWNVDFLLGLLIAGIAGAVLAALIGLPALRLSGLYLAVTTLACSLATTAYFLNPAFFDWVPQKRIPRLPLLGQVGYESPSGIYWVSLIIFLFTIFAVQGIRNSRTGRVLLALRDNENAATSYGVSVTQAKLTAFALSGFLAAVSGALFVSHQQSVGGGTGDISIGLLIAIVVGGIGSVLGASLGSLFFWGTLWWLPGNWKIFASGFGVLVVLLIAPGGLASMVYQVRDHLLRRIADRRQLIVPSLVADRAVEMFPATDDTPDLVEEALV